MGQERGSSREEVGGVLPLVALVLVFVLISALVLGAVLSRASARARAQHAADASALAGAVEGAAGAEDLAARNGATLVSFTRDGGMVRVVVAYQGIQASARAEQQVVGLRRGCPSLACSGP